MGLFVGLRLWLFLKVRLCARYEARQARSLTSIRLGLGLGIVPVPWNLVSSVLFGLIRRTNAPTR